MFLVKFYLSVLLEMALLLCNTGTLVRAACGSHLGTLVRAACGSHLGTLVRAACGSHLGTLVRAEGVTWALL